MDIGDPRYLNGDHALEIAILADPPLNGRTSGESRGVAGFRRHISVVFGGLFTKPMASSGRPSATAMTTSNLSYINFIKVNPKMNVYLYVNILLFFIRDTKP